MEDQDEPHRTERSSEDECHSEEDHTMSMSSSSYAAGRPTYLFPPVYPLPIYMPSAHIYSSSFHRYGPPPAQLRRSLDVPRRGVHNHDAFNYDHIPQQTTTPQQLHPGMNTQHSPTSLYPQTYMLLPPMQTHTPLTVRKFSRLRASRAWSIIYGPRHIYLGSSAGWSWTRPHCGQAAKKLMETHSLFAGTT